MPRTKMTAPRATGGLAPRKGFPAKISLLVRRPETENLPHGSLQVAKAATGGAVPPQVQEMARSYSVAVVQPELFRNEVSYSQLYDRQTDIFP